MTYTYNINFTPHMASSNYDYNFYKNPKMLLMSTLTRLKLTENTVRHSAGYPTYLTMTEYPYDLFTNDTVEWTMATAKIKPTPTR